jgi:S-adenosylmethionine hydrolase
MRPIITLTTDFGDGRYVAQVKGVLLSLCRDATIVDVTHELPPQDLLAAAYLLCDVIPSFPEGTIHLAVIDPGVGSSRRALALRGGGLAQGHFLIGPDNGIFTRFLEGAQAFELNDPKFHRPNVSSVFHGRDIFAPAAAALANGIALDGFGPRVTNPLRLELPAVQRDGDEACGLALYADHFGNVITNIEAPALPPAGDEGLRVEIGWAKIDTLSRTYSDVRPGEMLALIGSTGRLEIAVREGSAAERLGLKQTAGVPVRVRAARPSMYGE